MSLARVKTTKAAKQYECGACREPILKGESYLSYKVGFRSRYRHVRHDLPGCRPRPSELESSKIAAVYAAQEEAESNIADAGSIEEIEEAVSLVAEAAREVASEYEEASTDDNGTVWNTDAEERAQTLESAADDLEGWSWSGEDPTDARCEEHEGTEGAELTDDCDDCADAVELVLEEARSDALETIDGVELP